MKMLNKVLEADAFEISRIPMHQCHHRLRRWGRSTVGTPHLHPNLLSKSTATTPRTWPWPWPSTRTGSTLVNKKDIKTASSIPPSQYHVWPLSKRYGPSAQTQTHHDSTSPTRQTTTAYDLWSSRGCLAGSHCGDWQSRLWDHQSLGGASNQSEPRKYPKNADRSGRIICTWQAQTLCR